jgi:hypothetical protein
MKKIFSIGFSIILSLMIGAQASAWGHFAWLPKDPNLNTYLIFRTLQEKVVNYCVASTDPSQFSEESLDVQTQMALSVWLRAIENYRHVHVSIQRVSCSSPSLNLRVTAKRGEVNDYQGVGSMFVVPWEHGPVVNIALSTDFVKKTALGAFRLLDFGGLYGGTPTNLRAELKKISFDHPQTATSMVSQFGGKYSANQIAMNSYSVLIHEMGHAFGLCDTLDDMIEKSCDKVYRSATPSQTGVMYQPGPFFITGDDLAGLLALYDRYQPAAVMGKMKR